MAEQRRKRIARPRVSDEAKKTSKSPKVATNTAKPKEEKTPKKATRSPRKKKEVAEQQSEKKPVEDTTKDKPKRTRSRRSASSKGRNKKTSDTTKKATPLTPLEGLRAQLSHLGVDGFLVPSHDSFLGEYIPDSERRLTWLTGFTGSNGLAIVGVDEAAFFTDGRYVLQAAEQVSAEDFARFDLAKTPPSVWASTIFDEGKTIGFDPWLHTEAEIERFSKAGCIMVPLNHNLIDDIWTDRPAAPRGELAIHEYKYTGEYTAQKRERIGAAIKEAGADALIITAPDSLCWLLNIRGSDVPNTPFIHARGILYTNGQMLLFIDRAKLPEEIKERMKEEIILIDVDPKEPEYPMATFFANAEDQHTTFMIDHKQSPCWFIMQLNRHKLNYIIGDDPCQMAKACKNEVEQEGARTAHITDGVAVTRFLHWIDEEVKAKKAITERDAVAQLETFRKKSKNYRGPSFDTISGFGPNGAIVHYKATETSNTKFKNGNLFLVDSGGQYPEGTTDITRTIAIGKPKKEHKEFYTRVLKGHIALASVVFPEGTTGSQLDVLARSALWAVGEDYAHGTGHGVGSYLSVHEGPQRISKVPSNVPLVPGMIISNEPGYYKQDAFGIRIENLVLVVEDKERSTEAQRFFAFETLTKAPLDTRLIEKSLLSKPEIAWVNDYHKAVLASLKDAFKAATNKPVKTWLEKACKSI